MILQIHLNSFN